MFELSRLDLDRPGPSFTVDLLKSLQAPERELFFLAGADILTELPRWHVPLEVLALATLVVANRPGRPSPTSASSIAAAHFHEHGIGRPWASTRSAGRPAFRSGRCTSGSGARTG